MNFSQIRALILMGAFIAMVLAFFGKPTQVNAENSAAASDPEVGNVHWRRDFQASLAEGRKTGKPVLVLFQEVPGCHGCKKFGQTVLVDPQIVEAIETEFIPVLVYNNRGGSDAEILKKYREPSWNFQVVRFLDGQGKDLIPRKDKVWTKSGIITRMIAALEKVKRPVPSYLRGLSYQEDASIKQVAFSMYCYWSGEQHLGILDGVVKTEAGWIEGREVTRVWYDPEQLPLEAIVRHARQIKSVDKLYVPQGEKISSSVSLEVGQLSDSDYRKAKDSDQKKQIEGSPLNGLGLSEYQRTKINSYSRADKPRAMSYLSPRQRNLLPY